jgi:hypothetical protein
MATPGSKLLNGDNLLYRLFQKLLASEDHKIRSALAGEMIQGMTIWLPTELYQKCPVILPWVVRNPKCRPHKLKGKQYPDRWGAPDELGYQMDDNTLIKGIPKSLPIAGPEDSPLVGKKMGNDFVASHIWREVDGLDELASRHPELNSFVPNLVWLPSQISKLSDREGHIIQDLLKMASWKIYRGVKVDENCTEAVEAIWNLLEKDLEQVVEKYRFNPEVAHYFLPKDEKFVLRRAETARKALEFISSCEKGTPTPSNNITARYVEGLPKVSQVTISKLKKQVSKFIAS